MRLVRNCLTLLLLVSPSLASAAPVFSNDAESHDQVVALEGYFVFPEEGSSADVRLRTVDSEGTEATYVLKLRADQKDWAVECGDDPVKVEGVFKKEGVVVPTKLCHWYLDDTAWEMVCECNRYRAAHKLPPLQPARELLKTAFQHTWNMRHRYGFRHGGTSGWSGENIAAGQPDPIAVTRTWYNSSGHRANMLNPNYRFIGVGYYNGLWTQQFK
jgi:hypothetical protein